MRKILSIYILENNSELIKYHKIAHQLINLCIINNNNLVENILNFFQNLNLSLVFKTSGFFFIELLKQEYNIETSNKLLINYLTSALENLIYSGKIQKIIIIDIDTHFFYTLEKKNDLIKVKISASDL